MAVFIAFKPFILLYWFKQNAILMRFKLLSVLILFSYSITCAQNFSAQEKLQGYANRNDSLYFIFDETAYNTSPNNVAVTGSFRNWDQNMADTHWVLSKDNDALWTLGILNKEYTKVKPASAFKFRTNTGIWQNPPANATNSDGGNLIFMKGFEPLKLYASVTSNNQILANISGLPTNKKFVFNAESFDLTNAKGTHIKIKSVQIINQTKTSVSIIIQAEPDIDKRRVYYLKSHEIKETVLVSYNEWFKTLKSSKPLGADIIENKTHFGVFAPRATEVKLYLYQHKDDKVPFATHQLTIDSAGVWELWLNQNLSGTWYDYTVHGFDDPGNFFYETHPVHISDPYARVSDDSFGKCMVAEKTKAAAPLPNGRPAMEDVIAYEVHVQDFTHLLPIDESLKGTIPAMHIGGLKNKNGKSIGFDHLVELGINTVHLMPVQEILHWPKQEWQTAFKNDPYMIEQGISNENYDWGYRTSHSFAIESRYRKRGTEPGSERTQFRDLVEAFHKKGIAVIVDVVFNHTAENMDGRDYLFHFNAFDKQYYYRTKNLEHIGAYGNETKSEDRFFTQRWIIDQCTSLVNEFGIDGFRIDLAGQTDKQTLLALKNALPKDIIIYGEPWIDSNDPEYNQNKDLHWYKLDAPICYFNDDTRNTYKGPVFELVNPKEDRGYAGGLSSLQSNTITSLTCSWPGQHTINSAINYLDIHDNFALADQFALYDWDGRYGVDENAYLTAYLLLFTTPGPLVLHGGSEFMRSKGLAPLKEIEKEIPSGKLYFHGKRDTYNLLNANLFIWDNVGTVGPKKLVQPKTTPEKPYTNSRFNFVHNQIKALINLRKTELQPLIKQQYEAGYIPAAYYKFWVEPNRKDVLCYTIDNKYLILINTGSSPYEFKETLPANEAKLLWANQTSVTKTQMTNAKRFIIVPGNASMMYKLNP